MADAFSIRARGEGVEGVAQGIDAKHVTRLRRGEPEADFEIDLHGLTAAEARQDLREAIEESFAEGARCLLVVHGRGRHSEDGAVLRRGIAEWITAPPIGRFVMAFTPALPADGGAGACYVLLRRRRAERRSP